MISVHNANKIISKIEGVAIKQLGRAAFDAIQEEAFGGDKAQDSDEEKVKIIANHLKKQNKYSKK